MHILTTRGEHDDTPIRDWVDRFAQSVGEPLTVSDDRPMQIIGTIIEEMERPVSRIDAVVYAPMMIQNIVLRDGILELSDLLKSCEYTLEETKEGFRGDFFSGYLKYAAWVDTKNERPGASSKDRLYGLPGAHTGASLLIARKNVFSEMNVEIPDTWDEFNRFVKDAADPQKQFWGTALCLGVDRQLFGVDWYARFASQGGRLLEGNFAEKNVVSSVYNEAGVNACRWIKEIIPWISGECFKYKLLECMNAMCAGKTAMQLNVSAFVSPQMLYAPESAVSDKVIIREIPGVGEYKGVGYGCGWSWAVLKNAHDHIAAWKMIQFLSSKEFDCYRCAKYGVTPVRRSTLCNSDVLKAQPWVKDIAPIIDKAVAPEYFFTPSSSKIADAYAAKLMKGILADDKPEIISKAMDEAANAVLKAEGYQK